MDLMNWQIQAATAVGVDVDVDAEWQLAFVSKLCHCCSCRQSRPLLQKLPGE